MPKARTAAAKKANFTPKAKTRRKKANAKNKSTSKASVKRQSKGGLSLFSFLGGKEKSNKNFSTNFQYGNLSINIKSIVKGHLVTFNVKLISKNFNFAGVITVNALAFATLQDMFDHIRSNLKSMR